MILIIDNYDSFTYNLYQHLGEFDKVVAVRNDKISVKGIDIIAPDYIVISPGPGLPENAGISQDVIEYFKDKIPILGVCLGHQCIASTFGGNAIKNSEVFHGKTSKIYIKNKGDKNGIFKNIKPPFLAARYHSLVVEKDTLPSELEITSFTKNKKEIMSIKHKNYPIYGLQFHPESILTSSGKQILKNFINLI